MVHMNKSIARYALRIVYDVLDFVATFCKPSDGGRDVRVDGGTMEGKDR